MHYVGANLGEMG